MAARVVNVRKESCEVFIGRPSKWGNPFHIGQDGTRQEVIQKYRAWILKSGLLQEVHQLRGKTLGCYCAPLPCHGDVLLELANSSPSSSST